jgi:hypothetical protein
MMGAAALLFMRCGTEDLGFIEPFELSFEDKFENLVTPPSITDREPVIKTPPKSEVKIPQEVNVALNGLKAATTPQAVTQALQPATGGLSAFLATTTTEKKDKLQSLTQTVNVAFLNSLKSGSTTLDALTLSLIQDAQGNKDIQKFLPTLTTPPLGGRLLPESLPIKGEPAIGETMRIQNLVGPCREQANEAYQEQLTALNALRTAEEAKIQAAFTRRNGEALARYNSRIAAAQTAFNTAWDQNVTATFNLLVTQLPNLSSSQVQYLILYIVTTSNSLLKALEADLKAIVQFYADEQKEITAIRTASLTALSTWYTAEKKELDDRLASVLTSCHNQGTGN